MKKGEPIYRDRRFVAREQSIHQSAEVFIMRSRRLTDIPDLYGHLLDESFSRRHFFAKLPVRGHHLQERIAEYHPAFPDIRKLEFGHILLSQETRPRHSAGASENLRFRFTPVEERWERTIHIFKTGRSLWKHEAAPAEYADISGESTGGRLTLCFYG